LAEKSNAGVGEKKYVPPPYFTGIYIRERAVSSYVNWRVFINMEKEDGS